MAFKQHRMEKIHTFGAASKESPEHGNWFYRTADDTIAQVAAANYFNGMAKKDLKLGDRMLAKCTDGEQAFKVTAVSAAGVVTIAKTGMASGQLTTVTAADTVVTGLSKVSSAIGVLDSDPIDDPEWVSVTIGDQAGAPAAGSIIIKTWKNTAGNDPTPAAATTFGKKVNWVALGD